MKIDLGLALTTHPHLALRLEKEYSYTYIHTSVAVRHVMGRPSFKVLIQRKYCMKSVENI
jgi:hypothetical protein